MPPPTKQEIKKLGSLDNRLATCREYKNLWQQYFQFFADGFEGKKITDQEEQAFFQIMNVLAVNHFRFTELAGDYFRDGDATLQVLSETASLAAIKNMSEATFGKLLIDWHSIFISMNKAIGKLMSEVPATSPKK